MTRQITIPHEPDFSPADIAAILKCPHRLVRYWIVGGKLTPSRTFRGKVRISREELVRLCEEYLRLEVVENNHAQSTCTTDAFQSPRRPRE